MARLLGRADKEGLLLRKFLIVEPHTALVLATHSAAANRVLGAVHLLALAVNVFWTVDGAAHSLSNRLTIALD